MILSACAPPGAGGGGATRAGATAMAVRPSPVRLADAPAGVLVERRVTLENTDRGRGATVHGIAIAGDAGGVFGIGPLALPAAIPPGETIAFDATYAPTAVGEDRATIEVASDAGGLAVEIRGRCIAAGVVADPPAIDFAEVPKGTTRQVGVEVRNVSMGRRIVRAIDLVDSAARQFGLLGAPDLPLALESGERRRFDVTATPDRTGPIDGLIRISSDDPDRPEFAIDLAAVGSAEPPGGSEFAVNRTRPGDQRRPSVAAFPAPDSRGVAAVVIYEDGSQFADARNSHPYAHWASAALDVNGLSIGASPSPRIARHTEGVGYIGLGADPAGGIYSAAIRWHAYTDVRGEENHPRSVFLETVRSWGNDGGGELALPARYERMPPEQDVRTLDVAVDPAGGTRFMVFAVSGVSASTTALPEGINARLTNRSGTRGVAGPFRISAAGDPAAQGNPRVAFDGTRYLVVWDEAGVVKGRLLSRAGEKTLGREFAISDPLGGAARRPRLAPNAAAGGFVVVWEDAAVAGRIVRPDGAHGPIVTLEAAAAGAGREPSVAVDPASGACFAVWAGPDASGLGVFGRRFGPDLAPLSDEIQINELTTGDQHEPDVCFAPAVGKWLVVWTGFDSDGMGIRGRLAP